MRLAGKSAIVTGGAAGFGAGIARRFAAEGAHVLIADLDTDGAETLAREIGLLEQFMGLPDTPENRAKFLTTIPLGRMSTPADIANACVFLAEDGSDFITGVLLPVDDGRTA